MATTQLGAQITELHGRQQSALSADTVLTLQRLFPAFDLSTFAAIEASWPALEAALAALIDQNFGISSGLAANYYELFRAAEEVAGRYSPVLAETLPVEQVATSLKVTGPYTAKHLVALNDPQAAEKTFVRLAGSLQRLVLAGGRNTIFRNVEEDRAALGWMRVTHSKNPCSFCRLLATRGPVYKTEAAASFKPHDHCNCEPEAVFSRETKLYPSAEADLALYNESTADFHGTQDKINAFRRAVERLYGESSAE